MANDRIDEQYIIDGLAHRHAAADAPTREALRQLATGVLRQLHSGELGDLDPLRDLLGIDEKAECAQRIVDWLLAGRRDSPPYLHRPEMRAAMGHLYEDETEKAATDVELEVLVNALAGGEADIFPAAIPAQRMGLARTLTKSSTSGAG
jgi:hypothetical protein